MFSFVMYCFFKIILQLYYFLKEILMRLDYYRKEFVENCHPVLKGID